MGKSSNNGLLCEKEEIQVSDPSHPGGADRRAFCQRGFVLQAAAAGGRFCRHFVQVKEKNLQNFLQTHNTFYKMHLKFFVLAFQRVFQLNDFLLNLLSSFLNLVQFSIAVT